MTKKDWYNWITSNLSSDYDYSLTIANSKHATDHELWISQLKDACRCSKIQTQTLPLSSSSSTPSMLAIGLLYQLPSQSSAFSSSCIQVITCPSDEEMELLRLWGYCVKPFYCLQFIQSIDNV